MQIINHVQKTVKKFQIAKIKYKHREIKTTINWDWGRLEISLSTYKS